ncbi:hypothetical protein J6590_064670 [Homalodisca vitripennis]|nr:hypothetical protein J6590_064670 [Homalodisca vitripennis]
MGRFLLPINGDILADTLVQTAQFYLPVHAVTETCRNDSNYLLDSLLHGDNAALEMLDAPGKLGPGLLHGELHKLGNYRQCLRIKHPIRRFIGKYCTVTTNRFIFPDIHLPVSKRS